MAGTNRIGFSPISLQATQNLMKIGQVARSSHLPVKTIRYYEQLGLLAPAVERSPAGYRLFLPSVLKRLGFIKQAQSLGLSLREVGDILQVYDRGELPCRDVKQVLQQKVDEIRDRIQALKALESDLQGLLSNWEEQPSPQVASQTICPNLHQWRSSAETPPAKM